MFLTEDLDVDIPTAFEKATVVLKSFTRSEQAHRYHGILQNLKQDINKHRGQISSCKRELSTRPVRKIVQIDTYSSGEDGCSDQAVGLGIEESAVDYEPPVHASKWLGPCKENGRSTVSNADR